MVIFGGENINPEFLLGGRLIPTGREGNKVYARTLRWGETDTGEAVHLEAGDQLIIPAGDLVFDTRQIDSMSPAGAGGYAPVSNTVWTWYRIARDDLEYVSFISGLALKLDSAHNSWAEAMQAHKEATEGQGVNARISMFTALAGAQAAIIALDRAIIMVETLARDYCPGLAVPQNTVKIKEAAHQLRRSFEHIDERAQGKVAPGKEDVAAWSIFDQSDFMANAVLRYQDFSLDFNDDVRLALLACREAIMQAIDIRVGSGSKDTSN